MNYSFLLYLHINKGKYEKSYDKCGAKTLKVVLNCVVLNKNTKQTALLLLGLVSNIAEVATDEQEGKDERVKELLQTDFLRIKEIFVG